MPYLHEAPLIDAYKKLYMLGGPGGRPYGNYGRSSGAAIVLAGATAPLAALVGAAASEADTHEQAKKTKIAGRHTASSFKESEKRASDMGHDINVGRFLMEQGMGGSYPGAGRGNF